MAIGAITVKVCGMRDVALAQRVMELGADFIGMIHHVASPRHLGLDEIQTMCKSLPTGHRVGVVVQPDAELVNALWETGVDALQVHLKHWDAGLLEQLDRSVPTGRSLWLAPTLAPGFVFPQEMLPVASCLVIDTYVKNQTGGTGQTGDWGAYRQLRREYPAYRFILAGGLTDKNISAALQATETNFVDVNSGVECEPGVKSLEKLEGFFRALQVAAHG